MRSHIIDELRPMVPDIDPTWEAETRRAILDATPATRSTTHRLLRLASVAAVVAALAGGAVVARNALPSDDVRPSGPAGPASAAPPLKTSATPTRTPQPEKTYVPAPGDPKTHELNVIIRDKGISYTPGTCVAIRADTDFQDRLVFIGPDAQYERRPLGDEFPIPRQATRLADGTCEAKLTVTIPYAPTYGAGIVREGKGIAGPDDPGETQITTQGDAQDVVVINYPT